MNFLSAKKWASLFACLAFFAVACKEPEVARLVLGKEYDAQRQLVVDTTSSFHLNHPFHLRLSMGKPFGVDSLALEVRAGKDTTAPVMERRMLPVDKNSGFLVLRGTRRNPLTAREFLRTSTPGYYTIVIWKGDQLVVYKTISLFAGKEDSP